MLVGQDALLAPLLPPCFSPLALACRVESPVAQLPPLNAGRPRRLSIFEHLQRPHRVALWSSFFYLPYPLLTDDDHVVRVIVRKLQKVP